MRGWNSGDRIGGELLIEKHAERGVERGEKGFTDSFAHDNVHSPSNVLSVVQTCVCVRMKCVR